MSQTDGSRDSVLGRALAVLRAVGGSATPLSRAEIARLTGLPKATANRFIAQLVAEGLLQPVEQGVRLGLGLFDLGNLAEQQGLGLSDVATPYLAHLYEITHETVQLAILDGLGVVYIQKISGSASTKLNTRVGGRMPLTCTASGKVLLAHCKPDFRERVLRESGFARRTPRSITDRAALDRELSEVRRRKYAVDREEFQTGTASVAVPVLARSGTAAAVTVSAPSDRLSVPTVVPALHATAAAISREIARVQPHLDR
ncbi:IclR family transcriptional regulator [Nonomuraea sp. B10E15]|uniref:IclR family transcriptional regulator n=1 Tax=Nonomuraea sp. B10E15 TaxID=3153560 RepID=UPI00325D5E55